MSFARYLALIFLAWLLGSCSYVYELRATVIEGTIALVPVEEDFWGNPDPECFYSIKVVKLGETLSQEDIVWQDEKEYGSCDNPFPVKYGSELLGEYEGCLSGVCEQVEAKPLITGGIYEVEATSAASGYGGGRFRYEADGSVTNLKREYPQPSDGSSSPRRRGSS